MKEVEPSVLGPNSINVLIIGNNPVELSTIYENLRGFEGAKFITEFTFSLSDARNRAKKSKPDYILVDDNLRRKDIRAFTQGMWDDLETRDIPIALLKSSNYGVRLTSGFQDFLMKENFSADKFYKSILSLFRWRKTQIYLYKTYRKSQQMVADLSKKLA